MQQDNYHSVSKYYSKTTQQSSLLHRHNKSIGQHSNLLICGELVSGTLDISLLWLWFATKIAVTN